MSTMKYNHCRGRAGYTLVEVLVVVTILGIASAIVVPQMLAAGTLGVQAAARIIIADILYAQNDAIAQQRNRRVVFDPDNERYSLVDENGAVLTARWISGSANNYVVDFVNDSRFQGVKIVSADFGGAPGDPPTLEFDALGGPLNGGTVEIQFQDQRYRVTVASFTGRVTVQRI